jgi:6-phosphofructokinase 1
MRKLGVLTSGGDSPGMNAAIRAVVRYGIYNNINVVGIRNGFEGLVEGNHMEMNLSSVADIIHRGGTILGSARSKEFMEEEGFQKALRNIKYLGIEGLVIIGGGGSFKGAMKLEKAGVSTVCIPGTIDNDLPYTKYTLGFFTALTTVLFFYYYSAYDNPASVIEDCSFSSIPYFGYFIGIGGGIPFQYTFVF